MCYNPYIRLLLPGLKTKNGKPGGVLYKYNSLLEKELIAMKWPYQLIPCGKCLECKADYAKNWANRLSLEANDSKYVYFITLTYKNAPMSIKKTDLDIFIQNLRNYARRNLGVNNLRFFASGEYGSVGHRSHFHLILFNVPLDLHIQWPDGSCHNGSLGQKLYYSSIIDEIWNKGFISVAEANYATFGYVARYSMKKVGDTDFLIEHYGLTKPYVRMSKSIGLKYFKENIDDIAYTDSIIITEGDEVKNVKIPRYFDKLLEKYKPVEYYEIKQSRDFYSKNVINAKSFLNALEIIHVYRRMKDIKADKLSRLNRNLV